MVAELKRISLCLTKLEGYCIKIARDYPEKEIPDRAYMVHLVNKCEGRFFKALADKIALCMMIKVAKILIKGSLLKM